MQKTKAIILGLLTLIPFVIVGFFLYSKFPTTPLLIIMLVIQMSGVFLAYYIYSKHKNKEESSSNSKQGLQLPEREKKMLKVYPKEFCDKLEKYKGTLYILGFKHPETDITIVEGEYNKLRDEFTLKYTNGIRTVFTGVKSIAVGYNQFAIYEYNEMTVIKNRERFSFRYYRNVLVQQNVKEPIEVKISPKTPVYMFMWE